MSEPARKISVSHALHIEIEAARTLLASFRDIYGDDAQARADGIEGETNLREVMAEGIRRIAEIDLLEVSIKEAVDHLKARSARFVSQRENLRAALVVALELAELPSMETAIGTIALKRVPPQVEIVSESEIPSKFWKPQEPKLDKRAVLAALKAREDVPGARLDNGSVTCQLTMR